MQARLSLRDLNQSSHPLLMDGDFSIFNDPAVRHTTSISHSFDLDGVCLISRKLSAFRLGLLGEDRVYTDPKVINGRQYLYKTRLFRPDSYDSEEHRKHATQCPGFKFLGLPGADLMVVGVLNQHACLDGIEEAQKSPSLVASSFFRDIFNPAVKALLPERKTRRHNLATTGQRYLPRCYRIYQEDLDALSEAIVGVSRTRPRDHLYGFYFVFYKYGQQQPVTHPFSWAAVNLDVVVADFHKVECVSAHFAISFQHATEDRSVFWDLHKTTSVFRGTDMGSYPLFGLGEVGNITSTAPLLASILDAWPAASRDAILVTFMQAYTPLTKSFVGAKPFSDHPYLLSHLLGREYINSHHAFKHVVESTEGRKDYRVLREAIVLMLHRAEARIEFVVTSRYADAVASVDLRRLAQIVVDEALLVEVPRTDLMDYARAVVQELYDPLEESFEGAFRGRESLSTVLLCETILSFLPSMSVRDMPYRLLKRYEIAPLKTGVIAREKRIVLTGCAIVDERGLLSVPLPFVERVFLPMVEIPSSGRKQVVRLMEFLDRVRTNDRDEIATKAASILVEEYLDELVKSGQVARASVLHQATSLIRNGGDVHSVVGASVYAQKVFDLQVLPARHRLHSFLTTALSFASWEELLSAISGELLKKASFVPQAILHESAISHSATSFHVLSKLTIVGMKAKARGGVLAEDECMPLLRAAQCTLLREFGVTCPKARELTRCTPDMASLVTAVFRCVNATTQKHYLVVVVLALIERAKYRGGLPPRYSTTFFQRKHNINRVVSMSVVKDMARGAVPSP